MKKMFFVLFVLLAAAMFGCIIPPTPQENVTNQTPVQTANYGDTVAVDYMLTVDGNLLDTNIESVAKNNSMYTPFKSYQPLRFPLLLGPDSGVIPGFAKGIVGMKVNETKTFEVKPEDGYGAYNAQLAYNVSKYYNKSAFETIPRSFFEGSNITLENGTGFNTDIGQVFVQEFNDANVTIMYLFQPGDTFNYNGFHHVVVGSNNLTYRIMLDVRVNGSYDSLSPLTGQKATLRVTALDNETMTIDENRQLAGKTLLFNVTLRELQKG
ncbi:MAG: FKBP-type peptidyl-prolyl cis-trans isomerase [Candidatus Micrarchaeota archaeon]